MPNIIVDGTIKINSVNTLLNQLVPIPINQFIETELILIVPSTIIFGILYSEAKKENNDE